MAGHSRTAHVVEMIIILVLGVLPSVITVSISGYRFIEFLPYAYVCTSNDRDVFFYTFMLPIIICATIGLPMLYTTFWILRRVSVYYTLAHVCACVCNTHVYVCMRACA